jgi:hypothetical protein
MLAARSIWMPALNRFQALEIDIRGRNFAIQAIIGWQLALCNGPWAAKYDVPVIWVQLAPRSASPNIPVITSCA